MNEDQMNRTLMISGMVLTVIAGLGTVGALIACAVDWSWSVLFVSVLLAVCTVGLGCGTAFFGSKVTGQKLIFSNEAEREVLTVRQRRELRKARAEVVMERALIEVAHEKDNIVHRQIESADDPDTPPYQTRWTNPDKVPRLTGKKEG